MIVLREQAHHFVITAPADVVSWLRSLLVSTDTVFYKRGGRLVYEEKKRKYITRTDTGGYCLAGFSEKIQGFLEDEDIEYRIIQKNPIPHQEPQLPGIELYDFQKKSVEKLWKARRGVLWLPTGAGKSEVVLAALRSILTPFSAIILCRSVHLIETDKNSWLKRGQKYGFNFGKIHLNENIQKQITVCSIPTLISRINDFKGFLEKQDFVFVDEGHEAPEQAERVLSYCTNAYVRVCLSATPYGNNHGNNALIEGIYGPCFYKKTQEEIHAMGNAPDVEIHTHVCDPLKALAYTRTLYAQANPSRACEVLAGSSIDTYRTIYEILIYQNKEYERIIDSIIRAVKMKNENALIFVDFETHARTLSKNLKIPFAYSGGSVLFTKNGKEQKRDFNRIDFEESNVWIVTPFLTSGFDFEDIHNIILCGGMKSFQRLLQRIGRGMRKRKKMILRIHDVKFSLFKHNGKNKAVKFLGKHYNERIASMKKALPHAVHFEHIH